MINVFRHLPLWCSPRWDSLPTSIHDVGFFSVCLFLEFSNPWPLGSCSTESHPSQLAVFRVGFLQPDCGSLFFQNPRLNHPFFWARASLSANLWSSQNRLIVQVLFGPSVVFVLGGPGAGKGTQCSRIAVGSHGATGEVKMFVGEEGKGERMSKFSFWRVQRVNLTPMVFGCFVGVLAMPLHVFPNCEDPTKNKPFSRFEKFTSRSSLVCGCLRSFSLWFSLPWGDLWLHTSECRRSSERGLHLCCNEQLHASFPPLLHSIYMPIIFDSYKRACNSIIKCLFWRSVRCKTYQSSLSLSDEVLYHSFFSGWILQHRGTSRMSTGSVWRMFARREIAKAPNMVSLSTTTSRRAMDCWELKRPMEVLLQASG